MEILGALVNKAKNAVESSGVKEVYQQGADRAKAYSRIARLTLSMNSQADELKKVYTEIGKLYFEQNRQRPEGLFAPLFAQAETLMNDVKAKEQEVQELKTALSAEKDIEVEITEDIDDFEAVVSATENEGKGEES
jgi:hypothetical protein